MGRVSGTALFVPGAQHHPSGPYMGPVPLLRCDLGPAPPTLGLSVLTYREGSLKGLDSESTPPTPALDKRAVGRLPPSGFHPRVEVFTHNLLVTQPNQQPSPLLGTHYLLGAVLTRGTLYLIQPHTSPPSRGHCAHLQRGGNSLREI